MSSVTSRNRYPNVEITSCPAPCETKGYGENRYRVCIQEKDFDGTILKILAWAGSIKPPFSAWYQFTVSCKGTLQKVWLNHSSLKYRLLTGDFQIEEAANEDNLMKLMIQSSILSMKQTEKNRILRITAPPSDSPCFLRVEEIIQKWKISRRCLHSWILSGQLQFLGEICSANQNLAPLQEQVQKSKESYHFSAKDYGFKEALIATPKFVGFGEKTTLGKGKRAVVKIARSLEGKPFARRITKLTEDNYAIADKNLQVLLSHRGTPGIVQLIDAYTYTSFSGDQKQVLILEYFPMDLFTLLTDPSKKIQNRLQLIDQLLQALLSIKGAHGDVKPDNILTDGKTLKLTDFEHYTPHGPIHQRRGTAIWAAPEIFENTSIPNSHKIDVWPAGMIIAYLFDTSVKKGQAFPQHRLPHPTLLFTHKNAQSCINDFIDNKNTWKGRGLLLTKEEQDFVKKMIAIDPNKRITIETAADEFRKTFLDPSLSYTESTGSSSSSTSIASDSSGAAPTD